jgi:hypothetical protein
MTPMQLTKNSLTPMQLTKAISRPALSQLIGDQL